MLVSWFPDNKSFNGTESHKKKQKTNSRKLNDVLWVQSEQTNGSTRYWSSSETQLVPSVSIPLCFGFKWVPL